MNEENTKLVAEFKELQKKLNSYDKEVKLLVNRSKEISQILAKEIDDIEERYEHGLLSIHLPGGFAYLYDDHGAGKYWQVSLS